MGRQVSLSSECVERSGKSIPFPHQCRGLQHGGSGDNRACVLLAKEESLTRLMHTTYEVLAAGIFVVRLGATLRDVGYPIQTVA